jgi:tRNA dimethylallyltransferase
MHHSSPYNLIVITGPTASGKTAVAANLAYQQQTEIISADSRQVYRGLNLGTGKDYADYVINEHHIPYHLIDIVDAGTQYNVFEYLKDFLKVFTELSQQGKTPVLCGGTGMYIEAIVKGYKLVQVPINQPLRDELSNKSLAELTQILFTYKNLHNNSDTDTIKRAVRAIEIAEYQKNNPEIDFSFPEIRPIIFGVRFDRQIERNRITARLKQRLSDGMVDEVRNLLNQGLTPDQLIYYGLEYKFLTRYVVGECSYDEMFTGLNTAIHQFAKRQMTWFRKMEREGITIHWIDGQISMEEKMEKIQKELNTFTL